MNKTQTDKYDAFIAGARWARMAERNAFNAVLLEQDAKRYAEEGVIACRGDGTLQWIHSSMANRS